MSRTETHTGTIRIITKTTKDTVEYINEHLNDYWRVQLLDYGRIYINETEKFDEDYCDKEFPYDVVEVKDQWWLIEFVKHKEYGEDEDLSEMIYNNDGTYDFMCQFYNGGACLAEVLGDMLERKQKQFEKI